MMKAVFMGTPDFAVPTLQKMVDMGIEITAVVTQPDKAKRPRQESHLFTGQGMCSGP